MHRPGSRRLGGALDAVLAQRRRVTPSRAYGTHVRVTTDGHAAFEPYGFAPPLPIRQAAAGSAPASVPQNTTRRMP
ncbi:MAG: hypothetical protein AB7N91_30960 [Candidatus Tectimicrobiota bacterium]